MSAIEATALTKRYGDVTAVDDLSMRIEAGEVFGFLGPNGAGKSTTIDLLLGFQPPSTGSIRVFGHDVTSEARALRARTGLLPEGFDLYENLSAREHLRTAIESKGAADDPDDIVERVGLDPADARRAVGDYSTGMTQRLALGIALVGDPDLLVLDEPSSGLDPEGIARLRRIVREEAARGTTVFFSSHVLTQVEKVCDRVGIMVDGSLVTVGDIDALREELGVDEVVEATVERPGVADQVASVPGVADVETTGDAVRVECTRTEAKVEALTRLHETATVRDFDTEDVSLESVFAEYAGTGRSETAASGDGTSRDDGENPGRVAALVGGD